MLLTITYSGPNASDLGYLLHKHPGKVQSFDVSVGEAHVFYPEASDERCTAAVLLEVDPIALVRNKRFGGSDSFSLGHYVNDRPYAASSMLAVAMGKVFRTAMTGRCDARPELVATPIPLEIGLASVPSKGADRLATRLFTPLGWQVEETAIPLDTQFREWGDSRYTNLRLHGTLTLAEALRQLYVLLPVLDDSKHYWVSDDEVAKLLRAGEGWLAEHPDRELITRRYLAHQRTMIADATERLVEVGDVEAASASAGSTAHGTAAPTPLFSLRAEAVLAALRELDAHRVADLGCGEGALLKHLMADPSFTQILGADVSHRALGLAEERLHLRDLSDRQRARVKLIRSSITYLDDRMAGFDAVVLMEVIEHVDLDRLSAVEASVFAHARPGAVIVTTPNSEYNAMYPTLSEGGFRHSDHRFEWSRAEFAEWAQGVCGRNGYSVELRPVGENDPVVGTPTQLALFRRA
ncbi:3' terminal RNA ribose 2'-O-methyltransferase Hen1 [Microbacterium sp. STN6]|uniref:3' terminal RNA ribose 2'-O-methyltransferase Hen1 n=1 Tax=Microbacterium sp. STN6 TaxID=2995588 RepID=UPI002260AC22|nr:3' terminal RNA ribose 2'-O-methyltransferase Hen1 [Microbacterium sp. STN6]MCX7523439.1 3' terminal RNA ribose 2'-O-methyltransferase Hen1 [Microbacterium sp. STN6]